MLNSTESVENGRRSMSLRWLAINCVFTQVNASPSNARSRQAIAEVVLTVVSLVCACAESCIKMIKKCLQRPLT